MNNDDKVVADVLNAIAQRCHTDADAAGWWDQQREHGTLFALMHSEISEAMEGARKDADDEHLPHRKSVEVELADTLIRIFDYAGAYDLDLGGAVIEKLAYNRNRHDHSREARAGEGGKKF